MSKRLSFLAGAPRISTDPSAEMAGPRSRVLGLIKGFESLGWEVNPFIVGDRVPRKWTGKGSGQAVSKGPLRTLAVDFVRLGLGLLNSWRSWQELGDRTEWVFEYNATLQALGWLFQRNGRIWVFQTEALMYIEAKQERKALILDGVAKQIELWAYRRCDVLACISETLRDILIQELDIPAEKIVLVPNGVDIDAINPKLHSPKRLYEDFTVGFVGSLYSWAGLDLLLKALYELRQEGYSIALSIVGDGVMRAEWEQLATDLNLLDCVSFVGQVSWQEVPQYISGFDIGFSGQIAIQDQKMYLSPMKLYEYMAMGKPVLASAFEDAERLIEPRKTGFLFEPGSKSDLKRALVESLECKATLVEMGRAARQEIERNHSWTARVNDLITGVEQVLSKRTMT